MIIFVEENPLIESIVFEGEKAEKHKDQIKELLRLREKSSFIENDIKADVNLVKTFYRDFFSDSEIVFYSNIDNLSEKIQKISKDEKIRKQIGKNGKLKLMDY